MRFVNYYWVIEMDGLFHYMGGMFVRGRFINIQVDFHSQTTLLLGISRISMKSSYVDFKAGSFFEDSGDELVALP